MPLWKKTLGASMLLVLAMLFASPSRALPLNPDPATFAPDNAARYFRAVGTGISVEFFDAGYSFGSAFGFYYRSAPSSLVTIFGPDDQDLTGGLSQVATIDFTNGVVYDFDQSVATGSLVIESSFTPTDDSIGFFYYLFLPGVALFSDSDLNPAGIDLVSAFPQHVGAGYLFGFENPATSAPLSYHYISGIAAVPEPATSFLLTVGLLGVAWASGRGRRRKG